MGMAGWNNGGPAAVWSLRKETRCTWGSSVVCRATCMGDFQDLRGAS